jgi:spore coat polysaccharide biosynthesis protein SpsF
MPDKVLQKFVNSQSILSLQFKSLKTLDVPIVLATTINSIDNKLEEFAHRNKLSCFRGSENNVLDRFISASHSNYLIRVCSDNPFLDIESIRTFLNHLDEDTDYISFKNSGNTPAIRTHWGLFAEVVKRSALVKAYHYTKTHPEKSFYREHVTNYIYGNPKKFKVKLLEAPDIIKNRNDLRFTIDTPEDFENMQKLYKIIERKGCELNLYNLLKITDENVAIKRVMAQGIKKFSK